VAGITLGDVMPVVISTTHRLTLRFGPTTTANGWLPQNHNLKARTDVISGTLTFLDQLLSRNADRDDAKFVGHVGQPKITIGQAQSTLGGRFCYIYV